ncbi:hypothetical protein PAPHI01_0934 [Pancytospora philotis]|nr:hypothetical protein PAPHI01_0934 [Pancytospora philotis]
MDVQPVLEVSIPSAVQQGSHTAYLVSLITNNEHFDRCYVKTYRRYSEFRCLHQSIKPHIPGLPSFPPKSFFFRFSQRRIEERRAALEEYIRYATAFITRNRFENEEFGRALLRFFVRDK